ncbi:MAG: hypothetical protein AAGF12_02640 [Myxococcota bacterium]
MTDFRPWIVPTLVGPIAGMCGLIAALLLALDPDSAIAVSVIGLGVPFDAWVLAMFTGAVFGMGLSFSLLVADVTLLSMGLRKLPLGMRAWVMALLSPLAWLFVTMFAPQIDSVIGTVLVLVGTFAVTGFLVRVLGGTRP